MNVNKKFDRFRQWGKERMGGEVATTTTDDFKGLEMEMDLRHQGMQTGLPSMYVQAANTFRRYGATTNRLERLHQVYGEA